MDKSCDVCTKEASSMCCVDAKYCNVSCQGVAWKKHQHAHKKIIEYIATGGIAGTTRHMILYPTGSLKDVKNKQTFQVNRETLHSIYLLVDKSNFYPQDQLKLSSGFDIPRYLYYYGDLVAQKSEVPELDFAFGKLISSHKETAFHPIQVKVGEVFEYKYGMSAINYPSIDLSDGLVIVKKATMEYNDQPGGTNVSVLMIKAVKTGVFKIIETIRHPNAPPSVRETRVIAKTSNESDMKIRDSETQKFIDSLIKKGHTCIETFEIYPLKIKYWCEQEICENKVKGV